MGLHANLHPEAQSAPLATTQAIVTLCPLERRDGRVAECGSLLSC